MKLRRYFGFEDGLDSENKFVPVLTAIDNGRGVFGSRRNKAYFSSYHIGPAIYEHL
jgi:hypothetical protein